jgi:hypothetical protein
MIESAPQLGGVAATPLNVTVPAACDVPKLKPLMVTLVPIGPDTGLTPVMLGAVGTVNWTALLASVEVLGGLAAFTMTGPVVTDGELG